MADFPMLYLDDRYASHPNWHLPQTSVQKRFSVRSRKYPFTGNAVLAAEDGGGPSFGIREVFTHLCQEFAQASLVLKFEVKRMVGD
jgi:hypothetical protein